MFVRLQLILINYIVFHLVVPYFAAHKTFLVPCKKQNISQPLHDIDCKIDLAENTKSQLKKLISNTNVKVILLNINLSEKVPKNLLEKPVKLEHSNIYFFKQLHWQMVRFDVGQNLVFLFLKFTLLNLTKINIGFRLLDIELRTESPDCLNKTSQSDFIYLLRKTLLDNAVYHDSMNEENLSVCNQIITERHGIADFQTICYTKESESQISCHFLMESHGWKYLSIFQDIIAIATLLIVPFFIPRRLYEVKRHTYLLYLPEKIPVTLKISETKPPIEAETENYTFPLKQYPNLAKRCQNSKREYEGWLKALYIDVNQRKIMTRGCAAAELSRVIYNKLFRCRHYSPEIQTCLTTRLMPSVERYRRLTWYHCCRWFMKLIFLVLLPLPWVLRLIIYYRFEAKSITQKISAIKSLNLKQTYKGTILNYIPPLHWTFLFIYSLYFLDIIFFGIFNSERIKKLTNTIKLALRDMNEYAKFENIVFHVKFLLYPLQRFGLAGLVIAPVFWFITIPMTLLFYCFYLIPMVNLIFRLLSKILFYCSSFILNKCRPIDGDNISLKKRIINFIMTFLLLLTVVSASVLLTECICFLVMAVFHSFIIVIIKANEALPYVSLGFLVIFYFFENINSVRNDYDNFQRNITDKVIEEISDISYTISNTKQSQLGNTAYTIKDSSLSFQESKVGKGLIYNSLSLLLFIDSRHRPHIPERFFYSICHLPFESCPGSLTKCYLIALRNYAVILVFLYFVFIVVQTFFGLYNVSSTNQMLATLAGGFLPLFIRNLIKMNTQTREVDMETIAFRAHFTRTMQEYAEDWVVNDFLIESEGNDRLPDTSMSSTKCVINTKSLMNITIRSSRRKIQETSV